VATDTIGLVDPHRVARLRIAGTESAGVDQLALARDQHGRAGDLFVLDLSLEGVRETLEPSGRHPTRFGRRHREAGDRPARRCLLRPGADRHEQRGHRDDDEQQLRSLTE